MRQEGFRAIVGALNQGDYNLTDLANKTGFQKQSVLHHIKKLEELNLIRQTKKGDLEWNNKKKYILDIPSEFRNEVLKQLLESISLDELFKKLKSKSAEEEESALKQLFTGDDKNNKNKLEVLLNVFRSQRYIILHKYGQEYIITWKGCIELQLCYVCKKAIKFSDKNFVMQSIIDNYRNFAPLMHVKCMRGEANISLPGIERLIITADAVCNHCGLPLSTKLLRRWYNQSSNGFDVVYDLLKEEEKLNIEATQDLLVCNQLKAEFWGIEFVARAEIEGKLIGPTANVKMNRQLAEEITKKSQEKKYDGQYNAQLDELEFHLNLVRQDDEDEAKETDFSSKEIYPFTFRDYKFQNNFLESEIFNEPNREAVDKLLTFRLDLKAIMNSLDRIHLSDVLGGEGVGPTTLRTLEKFGINTPAKLCSSDPKKVSEWLRVSEAEIKRWVSLVVKGIEEMTPPEVAKVMITPERRSELLKDWKAEYEHRASRFNEALKDMIGTPAYEIHSELKANLPENSGIDDLIGYTQSSKDLESSEGYSFIHTDKNGNRYHPECYRIQFELPDERPKGTAKAVYVDEKKLGDKKR